jgi:hypothetical protein
MCKNITPREATPLSLCKFPAINVTNIYAAFLNSERHCRHAVEDTKILWGNIFETNEILFNRD